MITYNFYHEHYYEITFNHYSLFADHKICKMLNLTENEYCLLLQSYGAIRRNNQSNLQLSLCFFKNENDVKNAVDGINSILVMNKLESK